MYPQVKLLNDSEEEMKEAIAQIHDIFKNGFIKEVLLIKNDTVENLIKELKDYGIVKRQTKKPTHKEHFVDTHTGERYALKTFNTRTDRNYLKCSCEIKRTFGDGTNRYSSSGSRRFYSKDCEKYLELLDFVLFRRNVLTTASTIKEIKKRNKI